MDADLTENRVKKTQVDASAPVASEVEEKSDKPGIASGSASWSFENVPKGNLFNGDLNSRISCTACYRQILVCKPQSVFRHPVLHVLLCKKCNDYYSSGEIRTGEDGIDEQCRWCGDGGKLIICDYCSNAFCKHCIKHNLGRSALASITGEGKWHCFVCDSSQIKQLVASCSAVLEAIETYNKNMECKPQTDKSVKTANDVHPVFISLTSSSGSDSDVDYDEVFGSVSLKVAKDYLKKSLTTILKSVSEVEKKPARCSGTTKSEKRNLMRVVHKIHKLGSLKSRICSSKAVVICKHTSDDIDHNGVVANSSKTNASLHSAQDNVDSTVVDRDSEDTDSGMSANSKKNFVGVHSAVEQMPDDMEALQKLHRQALDDENNEENGKEDTGDDSNGNEDDLPSSDDDEEEGNSSKGSDEEFDPKAERNTLRLKGKAERQKGTSKAKKNAASRKVQEIRDKIMENKLKHKQRKIKSKDSCEKTKDSVDESDSEKAKGKSNDDSGRLAKKKVVNNDDSSVKTKKKPDVKDSESKVADNKADSEDEVQTKSKKQMTIYRSQKVDDDKMSSSSSDTIRDVEKSSSKPVLNDPGPDESTTNHDSSKMQLADGNKMNSSEDESLSRSVVKENISKGSREKSKATDDSKAANDGGLKLDNIISNLEKMPKIRIKLSRLSKDTSQVQESDAADTSDSVDQFVKSSKSEKSNNAAKLLDELSSDEDSEDIDDDMDEEEQMDTVDMDAVAKSAASEVNNEDEKARRALLADTNDDDEDENDGEDAEDSCLSEDGDVSSSKIMKVANKSTKKSAEKSSVTIETIEHDSSDDFEQIKKKKLKSSKLLRAKLSDSDKETDMKKKKAKDTAESDDDDEDSFIAVKKSKKRKKISDEDEKESLDDSSDSDSPKTKSKRQRIRTLSNSSVSGEENQDSDDDDTAKGRKRKKIRKILASEALSKKTVIAEKAEQERMERILERQKLFNQVTVEDVNSPMKCLKTTKLVLEADEKTKAPIVEVHKDLICKLKPHQVEAVKFIWNCCIESLERLKSDAGSGCILAHCMGLGKTLSVVSFTHTVLANVEHTKLKTCLVLCPLNTILNWQAEFEHWLKDVGPLDVYEMSSVKDNWGRSELLSDWHSNGGVMIMGYEMFRNLSQSLRIKNKKQKKIFHETLLNPGPDIIVCDEGHILKNDATGVSKATNQVKTRRRIVLTGTPLQNNLVEYHCMVNFVKPNLLGSRKEFCNRFVNPIMNGQCSDSSPADVKLMKHRAHILHDLLAGCVQRKDYSALTKFLPPKHEYVISIRLSKVQIDLYDKYLERLQTASGVDLSGAVVRGARIFTDYQNLMKIWTHPWVLKMDEVRQEIKKQNACSSSEDSFIDNSDENSDASIKSSKSDDEVVALSDSEEEWKPRRRTRGLAKKEDKTSNVKAGASKDKNNKVDAQPDSDKEEIVKGWKSRSRGGECAETTGETSAAEVTPDKLSSEWWADYFTSEDQYKLEISGKLQLLAEVLKMSESIGDKVLLFSQSLLSLDLIENFLSHWDTLLTADSNSQTAGGQSWLRGCDYFRMDGSSSAQYRRDLSDSFNDSKNTRARLFLISTRAGSLGINLVAANRVIVFDASWNPTHDVQSIFRVYRFGQVKPVYVYRFLAQGTMEEKIYERQVTKQSLAQRVVDEHQIERHFTANDLRELYVFKPDRLDDPNKQERPTPKLPKDRMLAELLVKFKEWIVQYHEHDSLLENKLGEELTEDERKAAWDEFEKEKKGLLFRQQPVQYPLLQVAMQQQQYAHMPPNMMQADFSSTINSAHQIAQHIFNTHPGITQAELTSKVTDYLRQLEMAKQQELHEYRKTLEHQRLMSLQEERRRQEAIVNSYRSRVSGITTDAALDRDLLSILSDGSNNSRGAAIGLSPDVEVISFTDRGSTSSAGTKPGPVVGAGFASASDLMTSLVNRRPELNEPINLELQTVKPSTQSVKRSKPK